MGSQSRARAARPRREAESGLQGGAGRAGQPRRPGRQGSVPCVRTLIRYTCLSERTVQTALDRLEADGIIRPCDPAVVAAKIKRADRRPQGWDLAMHLIRDDLDDEDLAGAGAPVPGPDRPRRRHAAGERPVTDSAGRGCSCCTPLPETPVDNAAGEVQPLHPATATGCNHRANGVQLLRERGAAVAPEPSFEPSREPSAATRAGARGARPWRYRLGGGGGAAEFFAQLGPGWRLTDAQRRRLAPTRPPRWRPGGIRRRWRRSSARTRPGSAARPRYWPPGCHRRNCLRHLAGPGSAPGRRGAEWATVTSGPAAWSSLGGPTAAAARAVTRSPPMAPRQHTRAWALAMTTRRKRPFGDCLGQRAAAAQARRRTVSWRRRGLL